MDRRVNHDDPSRIDVKLVEIADKVNTQRGRRKTGVQSSHFREDDEHETWVHEEPRESTDAKKDHLKRILGDNGSRKAGSKSVKLIDAILCIGHATCVDDKAGGRVASSAEESKSTNDGKGDHQNVQSAEKVGEVDPAKVSLANVA